MHVYLRFVVGMVVVLGPESDDEDNNTKISQNIIVDVAQAI